MQIYDGEDFPDTYVKISVTQHMRIVKTKKTSLVRRTLEPSFNQSFDIKLAEKFLGVTFLTVQLKQSRLFAVKGDSENENIYKIQNDKYITLRSRKRKNA